MANSLECSDTIKVTFCALVGLVMMIRRGNCTCQSIVNFLEKEDRKISRNLLNIVTGHGARTNRSGS